MMKIEQRKRLESPGRVKDLALCPEVAAGRGIQMVDNKRNKLIWETLPALFHLEIWFTVSLL